MGESMGVRCRMRAAARPGAQGRHRVAALGLGDSRPRAPHSNSSNAPLEPLGISAQAQGVKAKVAGQGAVQVLGGGHVGQPHGAASRSVHTHGAGLQVKEGEYREVELVGAVACSCGWGVRACAHLRPGLKSINLCLA